MKRRIVIGSLGVVGALVALVVGLERFPPVGPAAPVHAQDAQRALTAVDAGVSDAGPLAWPNEPLRDDQRVEVEALLALPTTTSTSIGGPNNGHVLGSVPLPMRGPGFRFGPLRDPIARFGTVEMVQALVRAAEVVQRTAPGSELTINDLGLAAGGPIPHHGSHRAGRDVDVLFYVLDASGAPRPGIGAPIEPDGTGMDFRDLAVREDDVPIRIDLPRSWAFVAAVLADPSVEVQRIFLVEHVRTMLLEHARRSGADAAIVARFADLTCQPEYPHDDHFHFRFFCSAEDLRAGCADGAPMYPWHRDALRAEGLAPVMQVRDPNRPRANVTTETRARSEAGPMHGEVTAFLARREAWRRQPHPGRTYCR